MYEQQSMKLHLERAAATAELYEEASAADGSLSVPLPPLYFLTVIPAADLLLT